MAKTLFFDGPHLVTLAALHHRIASRGDHLAEITITIGISVDAGERNEFFDLAGIDVITDAIIRWSFNIGTHTSTERSCAKIISRLRGKSTLRYYRSFVFRSNRIQHTEALYLYVI